MSYVELDIEGSKFKVHRFYTTIKRQEDTKGRPKSDPTWRIFLLLDSVVDKTILNWMCDPKKKSDGKITIYREGDGAKVKEISFEESFCFKMRDFFNASSTAFSSTFIGISGKNMKINSVALEQSWPGH